MTLDTIVLNTATQPYGWDLQGREVIVEVLYKEAHIKYDSRYTKRAETFVLDMEQRSILRQPLTFPQDFPAIVAALYEQLTRKSAHAPLKIMQSDRYALLLQTLESLHTKFQQEEPSRYGPHFQFSPSWDCHGIRPGRLNAGRNHYVYHAQLEVSDGERKAFIHKTAELRMKGEDTVEIIISYESARHFPIVIKTERPNDRSKMQEIMGLLNQEEAYILANFVLR